MGFDDKTSNKFEELKGQAKEKYGQATDDPEMEGEGKADKAKADVKQAAEKIKDIFKS